LWVLGLVGHFLGGLIHILLVVALILAIIWLVQRVRTRH
jgi:flagellar biogenesis protein FliO